MTSPRASGIVKRDALDLVGSDVLAADIIITLSSTPHLEVLRVWHRKNEKSEKPPLVVEDVDDLSSLWIDTGVKDALTETVTTVKLGKPKDFFRVHPSLEMRKRAEIVVVKTEGAFEDQIFIVGPKMWGKIREAQPATLVVVMYRNGAVRIWPLKHARQDEKDNDAWIDARAAAREGMTRWVKIQWLGGAYAQTYATLGYAPAPRSEAGLALSRN